MDGHCLRWRRSAIGVLRTPNGPRTTILQERGQSSSPRIPKREGNVLPQYWRELTVLPAKTTASLVLGASEAYGRDHGSATQGHSLSVGRYCYRA